jgi:uncharacterized protein (TIRG00374 family)
MRSQIRVLLIVSLTVGLMAFFLHSANLGRVWQELLGSRWDLVTAAFGLTVVAYLLRVVRWRLLLEPIGHTQFSTAFRATVMGFAASSLLPGRVGEVLRPWVLARRESWSATAAFATIVVERLLDLLAMLLILAICQIPFRPVVPAADEQLLGALRIGAFVAGAVGFVLLALIFLAARAAERPGGFVLSIGRATPGSFIDKGARTMERFVEGLAVMRATRPLVLATLWSFPLWITSMMAIWLVSTAFGVELSLSGSAILMGLVVLGVSVPTPAGIGGYHAAYQLGATSLYGATADSAVAAAIVLHAMNFAPVTLLGLVYMAEEGIHLTGIRKLLAASSADANAKQAAGVQVDSAALSIETRGEDEGSLG